MADHSLALELFYDGAWHPAPVYKRDGCKLRRGAVSPGSDSDPASASATLGNRSGDYSPRSVVSALFGKIGQNTRVRLAVDLGPAHVDPFARTVANGWGFSPTAGGYTSAWVSGALADFSVSGGTGNHVVTAAASYRMSYLDDIRTDQPDVAVSVSLPLAISGDLEAGLVLLGQSTTTYYHLRAAVKASNAIDLVCIRSVDAVETVVATVASGLTHAAATPLKLHAEWSGGDLKFKAWQGAVEPAASQLVTFDARINGRGWVGLRSGRAAANTNVNPQFAYDDLTIQPGATRLVGEASWRPERAIKGDAWTKVEIAGVLQRIGRGTDPLKSALRRALERSGPAAYWPLEDGAGAGDGTSGIVGGLPVTANQGIMDFVAEAPPGGAGSAKPIVTADNQLVGAVSGVTAAAWQMSIWSRGVFALDPAGYVPLEVRLSNGNVVRFTWDRAGALMAGAVNLFANETTVSALFAKEAPAITLDGGWHLLQCRLQQSGADTVITLRLDGGVPVVATWVGNTLAAPVLARSIGRQSPGVITTGMNEITVSHMAIHSGSTLVEQYVAGLGHVGETAADRFTRLGVEEGIPTTVAGAAADSVAMGPQKPRTRLELLDEIARTDDASIFETRGGVGLTMRTGVSKLNQVPAFTISYLGQVEPPLLPVVGDAAIRNDVTAASPGGATRRVVQTAGPHNVQLPGTDPQGVGRYATRIDVNPATDDALGDAAGWRVNQGTFNGTWYAAITADLDAAPGIAAAVAALDIGDCLAIANLPVDEALETVESIIIGIEEDVLPKRRTVTFFCVPAEPYRVGKLSATSGDTDPFVGHVDTDGSTTVGVTAPGAATIAVATTSGPLWTVLADDFPFDVIAGGQRVGISAIAGAASPQTFTVQPGGRQVLYPIPAGSAVNVQQPIILAL